MRHLNLRTFSSYGDSFCSALNALGVGAAEVCVDGRLKAANQRFWEAIGLTAAEGSGRSLDALLPLDGANIRTDAVAGRTADYPIKKNDGSSAWVRTSIAAIHDPADGEVASLLLVVTDVTPRKALEQRTGHAGQSTQGRREAGGRLINALEAEKGRIARELHDDIGQSLAVLAIQLLRAGKPVSGVQGRKHADVPELARRLQEIAARVGLLSHELHSSRLEYLGLDKTIRSTCADFSKAHPMTVEFACAGVSNDVDSSTGLCILRVVQEALHNAAKHSRATRVKVELRDGPDDLSVAIADDGVGFDLVEASMTEGIGLISMRERVAFVGGTFGVMSAPGQGTRIEARVPWSVSAR
jgi:PAS domain S-box-containing protein